MPFVLPQSQPRQTGFDQAGFAAGTVADILLKALLSGQLGRVPTGGQFTSPTGQSTFISPAERVASNPRLTAAQAIQQGGQGTFNPTRFGGLQLQPDLSRQLQQAQLQQTQASIPYYQALTQQAQPSTQSPYQVGDILRRNGKQYEVVGFDTDGMPLLEPR